MDLSIQYPMFPTIGIDEGKSNDGIPDDLQPRHQTSEVLKILFKKLHRSFCTFHNDASKFNEENRMTGRDPPGALELVERYNEIVLSYFEETLEDAKIEITQKIAETTNQSPTAIEHTLKQIQNLENECYQLSVAAAVWKLSSLLFIDDKHVLEQWFTEAQNMDTSDPIIWQLIYKLAALDLKDRVLIILQRFPRSEKMENLITCINNMGQLEDIAKESQNNKEQYDKWLKRNRQFAISLLINGRYPEEAYDLLELYAGKNAKGDTWLMEFIFRYAWIGTSEPRMGYIVTQVSASRVKENVSAEDIVFIKLLALNIVDFIVSLENFMSKERPFFTIHLIDMFWFLGIVTDNKVRSWALTQYAAYLIDEQLPTLAIDYMDVDNGKNELLCKCIEKLLACEDDREAEDRILYLRNRPKICKIVQGRGNIIEICCRTRSQNHLKKKDIARALYWGANAEAEGIYNRGEQLSELIDQMCTEIGIEDVCSVFYKIRETTKNELRIVCSNGDELDLAHVPSGRLFFFLQYTDSLKKGNAALLAELIPGGTTPPYMHHHLLSRLNQMLQKNARLLTPNQLLDVQRFYQVNGDYDILENLDIEELQHERKLLLQSTANNFLRSITLDGSY